MLQKFNNKNINSKFYILTSKKTSNLFSPHKKIFNKHTIQKNINTKFTKSLNNPKISPIKKNLNITPQTKPKPKISLQNPNFSPIYTNPKIIKNNQKSFIQKPLPNNKITTTYYNSFKILYYYNFKYRYNISIINPYIIILFLFNSHSLNIKKLFYIEKKFP